MTQEELRNVFECIVKKCDMLINNNNYEADVHTQNTVEDIAELCNHILDGDYGKLDEAKEEPVSEELEEVAEDYALDDYIKPWRELVKGAFKDGAKWKEGQMMKDAIPATVFCESLKIPTIGQFLHKTNLKENDKVKVIIIKED